MNLSIPKDYRRKKTLLTFIYLFYNYISRSVNIRKVFAFTCAYFLFVKTLVQPETIIKVSCHQRKINWAGINGIKAWLRRQKLEEGSNGVRFPPILSRKKHTIRNTLNTKYSYLITTPFTRYFFLLARYYMKLFIKASGSVQIVVRTK